MTELTELHVQWNNPRVLRPIFKCVAYQSQSYQPYQSTATQSYKSFQSLWHIPLINPHRGANLLS